MAAPPLPALVESARSGDRSALEQLVERIQGPIYRLALHMLWHPEDAQDATQEILIRVVTNLGSFRGESSFQTWMYRIAANCLKTTRRRRMETQSLTFERFGEDLEVGLENRIAVDSPVEQALLLEEVKIGCTLGMLLCLERDERLAFVLGEILELDGNEAAAVLEITPAAFRKRLERSRGRVIEFTRARCGLVNPENACRCARRVNRAVALGRVDPDQLLFARDPERARRFPGILEHIRALDVSQRAVALYRSHGDPIGPEFISFVRSITNRIDADSA